MEYLRQLIKRRWYWFLLYALGYSALTTIAIYRFSLIPLLPLAIALLPLLLVPLFYVGALLYIGLRKKALSTRMLQRLTECTGVALIATVIAILPAVILALANTQAHFGEFFGDQLGLPSYMLMLTLGVLALAGLIQSVAAILSYQPARITYLETIEKKNNLEKNKQP
ncbi:MAG: hypothetical protein IJ569_00455 [Prevotella sp.]|nr:hypothetical protein [Prevotella sp.]